MSRDFFQLIEQAVSDFPDKPALLTPDGQVLSYQKLADTIEAFTHAASKAGIRQGDHISIEIGNYAIEICLFLALSRLGAVTVLGARPQDILAAGIRLDAVISIDVKVGRKPRNILFNQTWFAGYDMADKASWSGFKDSYDVAMIGTSSGTSGRVKFMPFSVNKLEARLTRYHLLFGDEPINQMGFMGIQSVVGFSTVMRTLSVGGMFAMPAGSAQETLGRCLAHKIGEIYSAPYLMTDLIKTQKSKPMALPDLKKVVIGGSTVSISVLRDARKYLCPRVMVSYGATESGPITGTYMEELDDVPGAVGFIGSWVEAGTVDEHGAPLAAGEMGRLRLKSGPEFCVDGYLKADDADAKALKDGWFYPGDVGYVTTSGLLVVSGRISNLINTGGNKLLPETIEDIAERLDGVAQAGVVGVPNANGFDDVCIAVIGDETLDEAQLRAGLIKALGSNTPLRIKIMKELPINRGGKVDRAKLKTSFLD